MASIDLKRGSDRFASTQLIRVVNCAVAVVLLAGCASYAAPAQSTVDASAAQVTEANLWSEYTGIVGTSSEQNAGNYVRWSIGHADITRCMTDAGFEYQNSYITQLLSPHSFGGTLGTRWLAPIDQDGLVSTAAQYQAVAQREVLRRETAPTPDRPVGYYAALQECQARHPSEHENMSRPTKSLKLLAQFDGMVDDVDGRVVGYDAEYSNCMSARGYDAPTFVALKDLITAKLPPLASIPAPGSTGGGDWLSALAYEKDALSADSTCRRSAHLVALAELTLPLEKFQRQNEAALSSTKTGWRKLTSKARQLSD